MVAVKDEEDAGKRRKTAREKVASIKENRMPFFSMKLINSEWLVASLRGPTTFVNRGPAHAFNP